MSEQSNTATLRQQAGRVDEVTDAMVERAVDAFDGVYEAELEVCSSRYTDNKEAAMRAALTAALAQNTQGDGEAVACDNCGRTGGCPCRIVGIGSGPAYAERARVPAVDGVRFVAWMIDNREGCYVTEEGLQGWLAEFLREEAAAPSQRAEVK